MIIKEKCIERDGGNVFHSRRYWIIVLGVLICAGIIVTVVSLPRFDAIIKLASASSQELGRRSVPADAAAGQSNPATETQQPFNSSVNAVTQAAVKLGVFSCVSRINQVATFFTANNKSGVYIFPPQSPPDQHLFSTSFELVRPDDSALYVSASFFPNQDAVYDTVEYVNISCEQLEKTVFKNLKRVGVLKQNIVLLDGGAVRVFLMPAGKGCVVIKKEVVQ